MCRITLLTLVLAASVLAAAPARADETVATLARATPVSAFDGRAVWSDYDPVQRAYFLTQRMNGVTSRVPVRPRSVPFDVDLGPDADGKTVATYSRCRRDPPPRSPRTGNAIAGLLFQWSRARGCDIYMFAFDTGTEVRVRFASTRGASEFLPTVWTDRIAFARVFERRHGRAGQRAYLYVRPNTLMASRGRRGRSQRVPAGARAHDRFCTGRPRHCRRDVEPGPTALDLRTRRLAFGWDSTFGGPTSAVYIDTLHAGRRTGRHRIELVGSGDIQGSELVAPQFDLDGHLVWFATFFGDTTASYVRRYRVVDKGRDQSQLQPRTGESLIRSVVAGGVDDSSVLYLLSGLEPGDPCSPMAPCIAPPGCNEAQPCELRLAAGPTFQRAPQARSTRL
jgi:hypothetical protein